MRKQLSRIFYVVIVCTSSVPLLPPAHAQYITDEQRVRDEHTKKIEAEHAFYKELEGQTFWFQPSKYMRARFYLEHKIYSDGEIFLPAGKGFAPERTTSFVIEKYIPSKIKDYGSAAHIYQVRIEDGTIAFMPVTDFGTFLYGFTPSRDLQLTAKPEAVHPLLKGFNHKLLTKSPEAILAADEERKRLEAEAEERAHRDKALMEEAQRVANEQLRAKERAAALAQKRKGGVRIGMTAPQVLNSSWGKPTDVNRTTTANGVTEQWVYGGSSYLYFTNGRLTAIQN